MTNPPVEILSLQSLLARRGWAESFTRSTLPPGGVYAFLGTDSNPRALLPILIDCERIAQCGPLVELNAVNPSDRISVWAEAIRWARTQNAIAAQIVCHDADLPPLAQLGWDATTQIIQLVRPLTSKVQFPVDTAIEFSRELDSDAQTVELVRRTLVDSLDLPEALAFRSPRAVLASWESIPAADRVVLTARTPAGVVGLLVAGPGLEGIEIHYLGIDHHYRRQGWGRRLLQSAVQRISGSQLTAFVDARNSPAIGLYRQLGFAEQCRSSLIFQAFR